MYDFTYKVFIIDNDKTEAWIWRVNNWLNDNLEYEKTFMNVKKTDLLWCSNFVSSSKKQGFHFYFKNEKDAAKFKLRFA